MGKRRKAREAVLQALYELEFSERPWREVLEDQFDRRASSEESTAYARELMEATMGHRDEIDGKIEEALENWDMDRLSLIDKNILRFALAELLYLPQVPASVTINEAIEVAQKYSSADAGKFINGILDSIARTLGSGEKP